MSLTRFLASRIAAEGPMSIAAYMQECLWHPDFGYYATKDPLGSDGDFVTAPEVSQMFGELVGLCLAQVWIDQGRPGPFTLAELGPGRGTLMADIRRATRNVPGFLESADTVLLDASPVLRAAQADRLADAQPKWIDTADDLPHQPLLVVANEFFDALPIRQYVRDQDKWRERYIGVENGKLAWGLGPALPQPALTDRLVDTRNGDLVEDCPAATPIMATLADRITAHGGAAVVIDYGDWRSLGDTLQALRDHSSVDVLDQPGKADLTAHVDFEALAKAAASCRYTRLTPQGVFLERLGITARAQHLARRAKDASIDDVIAAHRRLTHPEEMGHLFKVMGLYPPDAAPPPGLEP